MVHKIWFSLLLAFVVYSGLVYTNCDTTETIVFDEDIQKGRELWLEKNCQSCHQLYGLGGYMGPDLTNVYSTSGKGPDYMKAFIKHGTGKMPDYNLSDIETGQLISFLKWVDNSGKAEVSESSVHWTGTYILNE